MRFYQENNNGKIHLASPINSGFTLCGVDVDCGGGSHFGFEIMRIKLEEFDGIANVDCEHCQRIISESIIYDILVTMATVFDQGNLQNFIKYVTHLAQTKLFYTIQHLLRTEDQLIQVQANVQYDDSVFELTQVGKVNVLSPRNGIKINICPSRNHQFKWYNIFALVNPTNDSFKLFRLTRLETSDIVEEVQYKSVPNDELLELLER